MIKYKAVETEAFESYIERLYPEDSRIHIITFQVTEDCCLRCTYCYQHNKTNNKLSFQTAKQFIDELLDNKYDYLNQYNTKGIVLDFIGGEPMLEIELIGQIIEYTFSQMIIKNHPWLYYSIANICSNGVLYNDSKVQNFFKKYGYLTHLGISIDGNKELHDSCRIDINGHGSYDKAISAVKEYRKTFNREAPTKMTLSPNNIQYLSSAIFNLIQEEYDEIHLNCMYEPGWENIHAKIMYNELKIVADYLLDNNLYNKIFISLFNEDFFEPMNESENQNWCGGTVDGGNLALNYSGKLYPCIRYMNSSLNGKQNEIYIGEVGKGILHNQIEINNYNKIKNITRRSQSTDECFYCPVANGCAWCSAYNYEETGNANSRLTYICIMHKARTLANIYYWNKLYRKLNLPKRKYNFLAIEDSLKIIDTVELQYLNYLMGVE